MCHTSATMAEVEIQAERVDDIPLLIHQQQEMGIRGVLDTVIDPHGNRQGLSIGWLAAGWLSYVLSEADHRMSEVESWAAERMETLMALLPGMAGEKDFTDDRLADVLRWLSDDGCWADIERQLGSRMIRVYDLRGRSIRLDSTAAAVYHDTEGNTLFRHGHSKDHRPDLPQFKVMLATLDPMGMPLATLVVAGNEGDDGLYVPVIQRARPIEYHRDRSQGRRQAWERSGAAGSYGWLPSSGWLIRSRQASQLPPVAAGPDRAVASGDGRPGISTGAESWGRDSPTNAVPTVSVVSTISGVR